MNVIFTNDAEPSFVLSYAFSNCSEQPYSKAVSDFMSLLEQCSDVTGDSLSVAFQTSSFLKDKGCMGLSWNRQEWRSWMRDLEQYVDFNHRNNKTCNTLYATMYNCLKEHGHENALLEFRGALSKSIISNGLSYFERHLPDILAYNDEASIGYIAYTEYSSYQELHSILQRCSAPKKDLQRRVLDHLTGEWTFLSTWESWLKENQARAWLDINTNDGLIMALWLKRLLPCIENADALQLIEMANTYSIALDHPLSLDCVLHLSNDHPIFNYYMEHHRVEIDNYKAALSMGLTWEDCLHSKKLALDVPSNFDVAFD